MTDKHPELGPLSASEVELVKKHREDQQKGLGWYLGVQAVINAYDLHKWDDTSVTPERQRELFRFELKRIQNNPKIY